MNRAPRLLLIGALAAISLWLWTIFFPSPERVIRKNLQSLARSASFSPNEGMLVRLARSEKLGNYFSKNVEVNLDIPNRGTQRLMDHDEIVQAAVAARSAINTLDVRFPNITVKVSPDKQSANVELTLEASISDDPDGILQEMNLTLQKIAGHWLITRLKTVRVFSALASRSSAG
jgi:hypothetical protein